MNRQFEMVAKTMQGLEEVLAEELRNLGALNVEPGRRMVSFEGDLEMLYRANLSLRTALRVLKPVHKFYAADPDELYDGAKDFDWGSVLTPDKTFCIDTVAYSDDFTHSQYATYRVKDAIVDWFRDRYGENTRPGIRLRDADVMINVHIAGNRVTLSLDSSGESLHHRGYRVAQTEAPINEVLAAGIILRSGWRGDCPLVDPMCGSGTFLIEAALIAANINPGIYRRGFAFENWPDFDQELFDRLYNDDSAEREVNFKIYGADISPAAIAIAAENIKSAGVAKYIDLQVKPLSAWDEAPENGVLITNPPYGERISVDDMEGLYQLIGNKLKNIFKGYHAWIIGYRQDYFDAIRLSPSTKIPMLNGSLECELREYVIFEGDYKSFRRAGGKIHFGEEQPEARDRKPFGKKHFDRDDDRKPFGKKRFDRDDDRKPFGKKHFDRDDDRKPFKKRFDRDDDRKPFGKKRFDRDDDRKTFKKRFDRDDDRRAERAPEPENPLAVRRNKGILDRIMNRDPLQPKLDAPRMRSRKNREE